jgi:hypothetical protein
MAGAEWPRGHGDPFDLVDPVCAMPAAIGAFGVEQQRACA